jgi:hypothetical protein
MKGNGFALDLLRKKNKLQYIKKKTIQCFSIREWGISIILLYTS